MPRRVFYIYKGLLQHWSAYFRGAFRTGIEGKLGCFELPDVDQGAFEAFFMFVLTGSLYNTGFHPVNDDGMTRTTLTLSQPDLVQAWLLGDYLGAPAFQNKIIDEMHQSQRKWKHFDHLVPSMIYNNTVDGHNKLRAFIVECYLLARPSLLQDKDKVVLEPKDFLAELFLRYRRLNPSQPLVKHAEMDLTAFYVSEDAVAIKPAL